MRGLGLGRDLRTVERSSRPLTAPKKAKWAPPLPETPTTEGWSALRLHLIGLVLNVRGQVLKSGQVLAGVVPAEQKVATGSQNYAYVCLCTAAIAAVACR